MHTRSTLPSQLPPPSNASLPLKIDADHMDSISSIPVGPLSRSVRPANAGDWPVTSLAAVCAARFVRQPHRLRLSFILHRSSLSPLPRPSTTSSIVHAPPNVSGRMGRPATSKNRIHHRPLSEKNVPGTDDAGPPSQRRGSTQAQQLY